MVRPVTSWQSIAPRVVLGLPSLSCIQQALVLQEQSLVASLIGRLGDVPWQQRHDGLRLENAPNQRRSALKWAWALEGHGRLLQPDRGGGGFRSAIGLNQTMRGRAL